MRTDLLDFTYGRPEKFWQMCQATIGGGLLTDGLPVFGEILMMSTANPRHFVLLYVPPVPSADNSVRSGVVHEVECVFHDATLPWNAALSPSGGSVITQTGPGGVTLVQASPAANIGGSLTIQIPLGFGPNINFDHTDLSWGFVGENVLDAPGGNVQVNVAPVSPPVAPMTFTIADPHGPAPIMNVVFSSAIGITINSALTLSGLNYSGNVTGLNFTCTVPTFTQVANGNRGPFRIGIFLYVADFDDGQNKWMTRDPINVYYDRNSDYLDLVYDTYYPTGGLGSAAGGRSWGLKLPCPIKIGPGQALVATFSANQADSFVPEIVPYLRCSYSGVTDAS